MNASDNFLHVGAQAWEPILVQEGICWDTVNEDPSKGTVFRRACWHAGDMIFFCEDAYHESAAIEGLDTIPLQIRKFIAQDGNGHRIRFAGFWCLYDQGRETFINGYEISEEDSDAVDWQEWDICEVIGAAV